ncbi:hypothetical protein KC19_2G155600, partial [Ceratodon purpureus]
MRVATASNRSICILNSRDVLKTKTKFLHSSSHEISTLQPKVASHRSYGARRRNRKNGRNTKLKLSSPRKSPSRHKKSVNNSHLKTELQVLKLTPLIQHRNPNNDCSPSTERTSH